MQMYGVHLPFVLTLKNKRSTPDKPLIELNEVVGSTAASSLSEHGDPAWLLKGAIGLQVSGIQANLQTR